MIVDCNEIITQLLNVADVKDWNRVSLSHIDEQEVALLVKTITVPENWVDKNIFLRSDSIYPAGIIYVNGIKVGEYYSGLIPVEFISAILHCRKKIYR